MHWQRNGDPKFVTMTVGTRENGKELEDGELRTNAEKGGS